MRKFLYRFVYYKIANPILLAYSGGTAVRWIAHEEGDRAGFDILSKNINGTDKYIEVKTTKLGKETPFFFSRNELDFSIEKSENYHLFRLFNFEEQAKMFIKNGNLNSICHSVPMTFKGYI